MWTPSRGSEPEGATAAHRETGALGHSGASYLGAALRAYRVLREQSVLHDVLRGARHRRPGADVQAFVLQEPGLHVLGELFVRGH